MGVATSGALLFRQIGGSVGIAIFGAIFANRLHGNLTASLPPGTHLPKTVSPAVILPDTNARSSASSGGTQITALPPWMLFPPSKLKKRAPGA